MSPAALSVPISIGLHAGAFAVAIALSGSSSSLPHFHLRQGGPVVLEGSFAAAEPTWERTHYISLPPAIDHGESLAVTMRELAPAAIKIRPVQTSIETSLAEIKLPAEHEDCKCAAPEHTIQTPQRSLDAPPQFVSSVEAQPSLRRRDLADPVASVSTEVVLPSSSGSGGSDVDVLPRKVAANRRPTYPAGAEQRREQGVVTLEVRVNAQGTVDSLRVVESSGFDSLDKSALDTVAEWRFEPAQRGGRPVEAVVNVPVRFRLPS